MGSSPRHRRLGRVVPALVSLAVAAALLVATAVDATAAPAPVLPAPATGVTADRLPTVQIDGVVWSQAVVGTTVYAGGSLANARPAGATPGTNLTPRANLLAYDITTGNLVTSFAPSLNGQVMGVAASPDGSRIYVVGDFTTANGLPRAHLAAYSTTTGALLTSFAPLGPTARARAVVATNSTVYVGGGFQGVAGGSTLRNNLAAFRASDGALLPWNPNADLAVWALAATPDGSRVYAGGSFTHVGGLSAYGLAKIDGTSGALDSSWDPPVNNAGPDTGISSLTVRGSFVYGSAWSFGNGANLEGSFKIPLDNSNPAWVTACHGDIYSTFLSAGVVYTAGHPHYCGAMGGGFPQYPQWRFQHSMAWSDTVTGEILNDSLGYPNWHGVAPGAALVSWLPDMTIGSYTGQYQAGWSVSGNEDYVVYGGEFPTVNGVGQQGLVRFARRPIAPAREGPRFTGGTFTPRLVPTSTSTLRVSWTAGYDRDSYNLTYRVIRNGAQGSPVHTTTVGSTWWSRPALGFVDTGLTPGATYSYQLVANDSDGNTVFGASASVTMPTSFSASTAYADAVRANGARIYWPMNETSGLQVNDRAAGRAASTRVGVTDGRGDTGITWNQGGAVNGDSAAQLTDNDFSRVYALGSETAPDTFSIQTWVRSNTTRGGRLLGFGDLQNGDSAHRDRHLYMDNAGRIVFGVRAQNNSLRTVISPAAYNNNQWHMVTASMSSAGMRLYVDGALVGSRADTTAGEAYLGYWRLGGDVLDGWTNQPSTRNFVGWVDEIAVYDVALSPAQVQAQYALRNGGVGNQPPSASFTTSTSGLTASVNGSGSSDPDGSISSYAWTFGDGTSATGVTANHTYAASGTYVVGLTVTDNQGATASTTRTVSVAAAGVIAADAFSRTVTAAWGAADAGGSWTTTTAASNFAVDGAAGTMRVAAGSGPSAYLSAVSATDVDLRTTLAVNNPGTGGGLYASLVGRRSGTNDYRLKVRLGPSDTTVYLVRTVGGAETVLASTVAPGLVVAAGDSLELRLRLSGTGTTTLEGKLWRTGSPEPGAWLLVASDTTAALQAPGTVGLYAFLSGSATITPITVSVPSFGATAP
ncbi:LamG-like jellyroll fold domain-containing protein [Terrabacter sp. Ter38]|uniref:LamG-like jellyroll fold domain-containing protein n=1 Tax=Terrabacter sp. Ter38 TaxID=2926030 RepID=UPI0021181AC7|nr:LamG-like jellyroll fold domain-containing protein [Terrabacter sp. Ter38]